MIQFLINLCVLVMLDAGLQVFLEGSTPMSLTNILLVTFIITYFIDKKRNEDG